MNKGVCLFILLSVGSQAWSAQRRSPQPRPLSVQERNRIDARVSINRFQGKNFLHALQVRRTPKAREEAQRFLREYKLYRDYLPRQIERNYYIQKMADLVVEMRQLLGLPADPVEQGYAVQFAARRDLATRVPPVRAVSVGTEPERMVTATSETSSTDLPERSSVATESGPGLSSAASTATEPVGLPPLAHPDWMAGETAWRLFFARISSAQRELIIVSAPGDRQAQLRLWAMPASTPAATPTSATSASVSSGAGTGISSSTPSAVSAMARPGAVSAATMTTADAATATTPMPVEILAPKPTALVAGVSRAAPTLASVTRDYKRYVAQVKKLQAVLKKEQARLRKTTADLKRFVALKNNQQKSLDRTKRATPQYTNLQKQLNRTLKRIDQLKKMQKTIQKIIAQKRAALAVATATRNKLAKQKVLLEKQARAKKPAKKTVTKKGAKKPTAKKVVGKKAKK